MKNDNYRELTPEELEAINGGGLKEIVAATTLAAMAMTGNTVSAFGLASALAEENAHIEQAPAQEAVGEAFEGEMEEEITAASVDEIVEEADMSLTEEGATEIIPENENASGTADEEEAVEEVEEADLGELTGEAEAEAEAEAVIEDEDRQQLMTDLITMAIEENKDAGIYAALDSTFATLADNAASLADHETGVIETDGNVIINTAYDALATRFDATPEQLMGAIGAAAYRADERGELQALGGDSALVSLAAKEDTQSWSEAKKTGKAIFDGSVDGLAFLCPEFKPFAPLVKLLFRSDSGASNAEILDHLNQLEERIKDSEQHLKDHMYNVVAMNAIGDKYNTVYEKANTVRTLIGDIELNGNLTEAEKLQRIAAIYNDAEFRSLMSAMNGASNCFFSRQNDIFSNSNIFDAAYSTACETVMFSSEALEISFPYIFSQFFGYLAAYSTMDQVYSAYEAVYGAGSLNQSRQQMLQRLVGRNLDGTESGKSILDLMSDYVKRDKFVFVNRSNNTNIALNQGLLVMREFGPSQCVNNNKKYESWEKNPGYMTNMPLSAAQVESLASYCAAKHTSILDFLLNERGFEPAYPGDAERKKQIADLNRQRDELQSQLNAVLGISSPSLLEKRRIDALRKELKTIEHQIYELKNSSPCLSWSNGKWQNTATLYLLDGAQSIHKHRPDAMYRWVYLDCKAINAANPGSAKETVTIAKALRGMKTTNLTDQQYYYPNLVFFQGR